jgi:hypothetical protein
MARAAQQRVADDRERHQVQTVLDGHARDPGVGQRLGDHEGPDRQPGDRVGGQPRAVVATKPCREQPHGQIIPTGSVNLRARFRATHLTATFPSAAHDGETVEVAARGELAPQLVGPYATRAPV